MNTDFQPGDLVSYCGEQALVLTNDGESGMVRINDVTSCRWRWRAHGEPVVLVMRKADYEKAQSEKAGRQHSADRGPAA